MRRGQSRLVGGRSQGRYAPCWLAHRHLAGFRSAFGKARKPPEGPVEEAVAAGYGLSAPPEVPPPGSVTSWPPRAELPGAAQASGSVTETQPLIRMAPPPVSWCDDDLRNTLRCSGATMRMAAMPLSSGTRLGPFEIQAAIGAGGMDAV